MRRDGTTCIPCMARQQVIGWHAPPGDSDIKKKKSVENSKKIINAMINLFLKKTLQCVAAT